MLRLVASRQRVHAKPQQEGWPRRRTEGTE
jgi:hypothetical protein